jgi:hypothetical protein
MFREKLTNLFAMNLNHSRLALGSVEEVPSRRYGGAGAALPSARVRFATGGCGRRRDNCGAPAVISVTDHGGGVFWPVPVGYFGCLGHRARHGRAHTHPPGPRGSRAGSSSSQASQFGGVSSCLVDEIGLATSAAADCSSRVGDAADLILYYSMDSLVICNIRWSPGNGKFLLCGVVREADLFLLYK